MEFEHPPVLRESNDKLMERVKSKSKPTFMKKRKERGYTSSFVISLKILCWVLLVKRGLLRKGLSCLTSPGMLEVNFLATSKGFFLAFTTLRNFINSFSESGPWLDGKDDAQSEDSSSV